MDALTAVSATHRAGTLSVAWNQHPTEGAEVHWLCLDADGDGVAGGISVHATSFELPMEEAPVTLRIWVEAGGAKSAAVVQRVVAIAEGA